MTDPKKFAVAVVGATGAVGEALLSVLVEREFPVDRVYALGSGGSAADSVLFDERPVAVEAVDAFDFSRCRIAFFCAPRAVAKKHAPRAVAAGCWVIDVSSQFRLDDDVPLVVPEINGDSLAGLSAPRIVSSPAAAVVQAGLALFPLRQRFGLRRAEITTLLAVSALGKAAVAELAGQTARLLNVQAVEQKLFPAQIAFNVLPAFDAATESGYTLDESNAVAEAQKLLGDELEVVTSQAFVPVFYGHTQIVRLETAGDCDVSRARDALTAAGLEFGESPAELLSPVAIGTASDSVFVGRCLQSTSTPCRLELWTTADNIRKGAAINAVGIAEALLKSHL